MVLAVFTGLASLLAGGLLIHKLLRETDPLLIVSQGTLTASLLLIGGGNWLSKPALLGCLLTLAALLAVTVKSESVKWVALTRPGGLILGGATLSLFLFTLYHQFRFLDTDNWFHEPIIANMVSGLFPPVYPYLPWNEMDYHYGRDLLIAVLTPAKVDPLATVWILNPILQLSGFLGLFTSIRALTGSERQGLLGAIMVYFGMCVGTRVGLVNAFDVYNGLAACLLFVLFHVLLRMLEHHRPVQWVFAAFLLGTYQLVYETFWGAVFIAGLMVAVRFLRGPKAWAALVITAVLALGLAAVEGGVFSSMVMRSNKFEASELDALRKLHVSATFPKKPFLKIDVTTAEYMRISSAYDFSLFRNLRPKRLESGPISIFSTQFLYAFWLPVLLAPWSLYAVRGCRLGLAYWSFGAVSFLIPGMVGFGERWDVEYFRWEFGAAVGFAAAFGMGLGSVLDRYRSTLSVERHENGVILKVKDPRSFLRWSLCWLIILASLAPAQKLLNDAVIDTQKHGFKVLSPAAWRVQQPELKVTQADIEATSWLADRLKAGDFTLTNLGDETASGIWPDVVVSARTGTLLAGRLRPEVGLRALGYPTSHRDGAAKAFLATGNLGFLEASDLQWYYADINTLEPEVLAALQTLKPQSPVFESDNSQRQVFAIAPLSQEQTIHSVSVEFEFDPQQPLRESTAYPAQLRLTNTGNRPGRPLLTFSFQQLRDNEWVTDRDSLYKLVCDSLEPGESRTVPFALVTPFAEDLYRFQITSGETLLYDRELKVDHWERFSNLTASVSLPDSYKAGRYEKVAYTLSSDTPYRQDAILALRLVRPDGEYVWEIDQIPQAQTLEIYPGKPQNVDLTLMAAPGRYKMELYITEPGNHKSRKLLESDIAVRDD